jgi:hypothetical protein
MPQPFDLTKLSCLLQPKVLGLFQGFEVITITLTHISTGKTFNLITVMVAQEHIDAKKRQLQFLGDRIKLPGLTNLSFGITRHEITLGDLESELQYAIKNRYWEESSKKLLFGDLVFRGHWFTPSDGAGEKIALNQILKNNFWNGSHIWEWTDTDKTPFRELLKEPRSIQILSEAISANLPIRIAGVSDKLGGLILQIPVQVLNAEFRGLENHNGVECKLHWLPEEAARPVMITLSREHDDLFSEAIIKSTHDRCIELILQDSPGLQFATIRDAETGDILGRNSLSFIRSVGWNMGINQSIKRSFTIPEGNSPTSHNIEITTTEMGHIGNHKSLSHFADTANRIYRSEMSGLRDRLELVQYLPAPNKPKADRHEEAIKDLRKLISIYGMHAVWLWDPFLDASDVLKTLFFNPHSKSKMRAISGANTVEDNSLTTLKSVPDFAKHENNIMTQNAGKAEGLNLEFRARTDSCGWPFHDRFIIFPQSEGTTFAWSLGTSINSIGKQHHILQKVPDGRLIADAFDILWGELNKTQHLVWKK